MQKWNILYMSKTMKIPNFIHKKHSSFKLKNSTTFRCLSTSLSFILHSYILVYSFARMLLDEESISYL